MSPTLNSLLNDFYLATGLKVALFDETFREICSYGSDATDFCALLHESTDSVSVCFASDIKARETVKESLDIHTFTCPFGIMEALSPIVCRGKIRGYIFIAGAIDTDCAAPSFAIAATEPYLSTARHRERLENSLSNMRRISRDQMRAVCNMLRMLTRYIADEELIPSTLDTLAERAKLYIDRSLTQKLSLADICLSLHCSKATLTATFRREFDMSVLEYINAQRMKRAEKMLKDSNASISEIAELCGYSGADYFSAAFKKRYGIPPSAWVRK